MVATGTNIPYIYKKGDVINGFYENKNHEYLNTIIVEEHDHNNYGNGGELKNTVNHGPFVTDTIKSTNLTLSKLLGLIEDGGYLYISDWTSVDKTNATVFAHNAQKFPKLVQCQIADGTINPPVRYQIAQLDMKNSNGGSFQTRGFYCYDINFDSVTVQFNEGKDSAGTSLFYTGMTENCYCRIVCLF
jgi:hypothetical protein